MQVSDNKKKRIKQNFSRFNLFFENKSWKITLGGAQIRPHEASIELILTIMNE